MPSSPDTEGTVSSMDSNMEECGGRLFNSSRAAADNTPSVNDTKNEIPELCSAAEQAHTFDPWEYLRAFYSTPTEDTAMHTVLLFLPGIIYWVPGKIRTLLDLGAGPTVYVPITFRNHAEKIYSADYAESNCDVLKTWAENKSPFEWTEICKWIACIEDSNEMPSAMEQSARDKFKAVLMVDLQVDTTIRLAYYKCKENEEIPKQFHVVVSIFCLEYSSENLEEYRRAVRNAVSLIEPNGFLIQGGVLQANDYYFGDRRYKCHCLTKKQVIASLQENNMTTEEDGNFKWFELDEVFLLIAKKKA